MQALAQKSNPWFLEKSLILRCIKIIFEKRLGLLNLR
jgi:hypothetical protein